MANRSLRERFTNRDGSIEGYAFGDPAGIVDNLKQDYGYEGDLLDIFVGEKQNTVHKWHHFLPLYERYFGPWRDKPLRFLEIGVYKGGSLEMWRKYFGDDAVIFGVDIDPDCAQYDGQFGQVRIGSQDDPAFLQKTVEEMGGVDVILDDGSHVMEHIRASLKALFPLLSDGGVYMIEDLHSAYWKQFGGGYRKRSNFFSDITQMVEDMHHWYHGRGTKNASMAEQLRGIHIHDSLVVLDKATVHQPVHSEVLA